MTHGISCLLIRGSMKILQATQTSFQSAPRSSHTRCMTSCLPSRTPTISLSLSHQLSKSSNRAFSGTLSISIRSAFTFSLQRRMACAKSLSAVKFIRRGCVSTKGMRVLVNLWSLSDGCRSNTPKKKTEALERPRRIALWVFSTRKRTANEKTSPTWSNTARTSHPPKDDLEHWADLLLQLMVQWSAY